MLAAEKTHVLVARMKSMQIWPCQGDSGSKKSSYQTAITGETLPAGLIASEGKTTILT